MVTAYEPMATSFVVRDGDTLSETANGCSLLSVCCTHVLMETYAETECLGLIHLLLYVPYLFLCIVQ